MEDDTRYIPDVGRYEGVHNMEYHRNWIAVNSSTLTSFRKSPSLSRWRMDHPMPETKAASFGTLAHQILIEPEEFEKETVIDLPVSEARIAAGKGIEGWRNTKEYKEWKNGVESTGKRIVTQEDMDRLLCIRDNVFKPGTISNDIMLAATGHEVSYATDDPEFDLRCKIRVDIESPANGLFVDVKTTVDASRDSFSRSIYKFGYYRSQAFYDRQLRGFYAGGSDRIDHLFLAIEKQYPCNVAIYELDDASMSLGAAHVIDALAGYEKCLKSGNWPPYPNEIQAISIPEYAFKQEDWNED